MIRRTDAQIKETLRTEYAAMYEAGCNTRVISRSLVGRYNPRLIIEAIQEYNDSKKLVPA